MIKSYNPSDLLKYALEDRSALHDFFKDIKPEDLCTAIEEEAEKLCVHGKYSEHVLILAATSYLLERHKSLSNNAKSLSIAISCVPYDSEPQLTLAMKCIDGFIKCNDIRHGHPWLHNAIARVAERIFDLLFDKNDILLFEALNKRFLDVLNQDKFTPRRDIFAGCMLRDIVGQQIQYEYIYQYAESLANNAFLRDLTAKMIDVMTGKELTNIKEIDTWPLLAVMYAYAGKQNPEIRKQMDETAVSKGLKPGSFIFDLVPASFKMHNHISGLQKHILENKDYFCEVFRLISSDSSYSKVENELGLNVKYFVGLKDASSFLKRKFLQNDLSL